MNVAQMEIFLKVAQAKQFSQAAKILHLTQPAISSQIKLLEERFGVPLFTRTNKGVELTEFGMILEKHVKDIVCTYDQLAAELDSLASSKSKHIRIGATQTIAQYILPEQLAAFKKQYGAAVDLHLEIADTQGVIELILKNQIDLGIAGGVDTYQTELPQLRKDYIFADTIEFIAPKTKQWEWRLENVTAIDDLFHFPFIMPKKNSCLWRIFDKELRKNGKSIDQFNTLYTVENIEVIKKSINEGLGISICSMVALTSDLQEGSVSLIQLPNFCMQVPIHILYYNDPYISSIKKHLLSYLKKSVVRRNLL